MPVPWRICEVGASVCLFFANRLKRVIRHKTGREKLIEGDTPHFGCETREVVGHDGEGLQNLFRLVDQKGCVRTPAVIPVWLPQVQFLMKGQQLRVDIRCEEQDLQSEQADMVERKRKARRFPRRLAAACV